MKTSDFDNAMSGGMNQQNKPHNEMPKDTVEEYTMPSIEHNCEQWIRLVDHENLKATAYNKGVEVGRECQDEWYLGKKIQAFGGEYIVVGVSRMIYDEDCEGEPEWKITSAVQEGAIATPFKGYSFQKPSWHKVSALTPLPDDKI